MSLALKRSPFPGISPRELSQQLAGKKKCAAKLTAWHNTPGIYYPPSLHIEQSSSETTARYKASLITGESLLDLTAGMGVDMFYFSAVFRKVFGCEKDEQLAKITKHNLEVLGAHNAKVYPVDGIDFLQKNTGGFSYIYLDPSRRDENERRIYRLEDSSPKVLEVLPLIKRHTQNVLIKTAPLLDIDSGLKSLHNVKEVHVVAVKDEVKELLWKIESGYDGEPSIVAVNINGDKQDILKFKRSEESGTPQDTGFHSGYLYIPNSALMKAGAFKLTGAFYGVTKMHQHSHLYTSRELVNFPGRVLKIDNTLPFNSASIKKAAFGKANIATRNFPLTVKEIRKKFQIKDGGDRYLFFTTDNKGKLVILDCSKA